MTNLDFPRPLGAVPLPTSADPAWRLVSPGMYELDIDGATYFVAHNGERVAPWTVGVRVPGSRCARFIDTAATLWEAKKHAEDASALRSAWIHRGTA